MRNFYSYLTQFKAFSIFLTCLLSFSVYAQNTNVTVIPTSVGSTTACADVNAGIKLTVGLDAALIASSSSVSFTYEEFTGGTVKTVASASQTNALSFAAQSSNTFKVLSVTAVSGASTVIYTPTGDNVEAYTINPTPTGTLVPISADRILAQEASLGVVYTNANPVSSPYTVEYTLNSNAAPAIMGITSGSAFTLSTPLPLVFGNNQLELTKITDSKGCVSIAPTGVSSSFYRQNAGAIVSVTIDAPTRSSAMYCAGDALIARVNSPLPTNENYTLIYKIIKDGVESSSDFSASVSNSNLTFSTALTAVNGEGIYSIKIISVSSKTISPVEETETLTGLAILSNQVTLNQLPALSISFVNSRLSGIVNYFCDSTGVVVAGGNMNTNQLRLEVANGTPATEAYDFVSSFNGVAYTFNALQLNANKRINRNLDFIAGPNLLTNAIITNTTTGCASINQATTIEIKPRPTGKLENDKSVYCEGDVTKFVATALTGTSPFSLGYSFNSTATIVDPAINLTTPKTINLVSPVLGANTVSAISLADKFCEAVIAQDVTVSTVNFNVNPKPSASFNLSSPICASSTGNPSVQLLINANAPVSNAPYRYVGTFGGVAFDELSDASGNLNKQITLPVNSGTVVFDLNRIEETGTSPKCVNMASPITSSSIQITDLVVAQYSVANEVVCQVDYPVSQPTYTFNLNASGTYNLTYRIKYARNTGEETSVAFSTLTTTKTSVGNVLTFTLDELRAAVPTNAQGVRYTIEFLSIANSATPTCLTTLTNSSKPYIIPTPTTFSFSTAAVNPVCESTPVDIKFGFDASNTATLVYTINGGADVLALASALNASGNIYRNVTSSETVQLSNLALGSNAIHFKEIRIVSNGLTCSRTIPATVTDLNIQVNAKPTINATDVSVTNSTICEGSSAEINYKITGSLAPYTLTLSDGSGTPIAPLTSDGLGNVTFTSANLLATTSFTVVSVSDNNACTNSMLNPAIVSSITVIKKPTAVFVSSQATSFCADASVNLLANVTGTGIVSITLGRTAALPDTTIKVTAGVNVMLPVNVQNGQTITYTVKSISDESLNPNCPNATPAPSSITVAKKIKPILAITTTTPDICFGTSPSLSVNIKSSNLVQVSYTIRDNGNILATLTNSGATGGANYPYTLAVNPSSGTHSYTVTDIQDDKSCLGEQVTPVVNNVVTVKQELIPTLTADNAIICNNSTAEFKLIVSGMGGPYRINYKLNGTAQAPVNTNGIGEYTFTYPNSTVNQTLEITSLTYLNGAACAQNFTTISKTVSIQALPTAVFANTALASVCADAPGIAVVNVTGQGTISFTVTDGAAFSKTISGAAGPLNVNLNGLAIGSHTLKISNLTASGGTTGIPCSAVSNSQATITVNPKPTVAIAVGNSSICSGDAVSFNATPTGLSPFVLFYKINGGAEQSVSLPSLSSNSFTITGITSSGNISFTRITDAAPTTCATALTNSFPITVNPQPTVASALLSSTKICRGNTIDLNLTFAGTAPFEFDINYLLNGVLKTENITGINGNSYKLTLTPDISTDFTITRLIDATVPSCTNVPGVVAHVDVVQEPQVTFTAPSSVCAGDPVTLSGVLSGAVGNNYTLSFSDGSLLFPINVVGNLPQAYSFSRALSSTTTYTLVSVKDNSSTPTCTFVKNLSNTVIVNPTPTATISALPKTVCEADLANVTLSFNLNGSGNINVNWEARQLSNGAILANGSVSSPSGTVTNPVTFTTAPTNDFQFLITSITSSTGSCLNTNLTNLRDTVRFNPTPTVTLSGGGTVCEGDNMLVNAIITGKGSFILKLKDDRGTEYTRNFTSAGNYQIAIPAPLVSNPTAAESLKFVSYILNSTNGVTCSNAALITPNLNFNINPKPILRLGATKTNIAQGASSDLTFTVERGVGPFDVVLSDGTVDRNIVVSSSGVVQAPDNSTVTPSSTTTYSIKSVKDNNFNCTTTTPSIVTITVVNAEIALSGSGSICFGQDAPLNFSSKTTGVYSVTVKDNFGNVYPPVNYNGATGAYSPAITPLTVGNAVFTIQSAQLGATTVTFAGSANITVLDKRTVALTNSNATICQGQGAFAKFDIIGNGTFTITYNVNSTSFSFTATQANSPVTRAIPANLLNVGANNITITSVTNSIPGNATLCPIDMSAATDVITVRPTPSAGLTFNPTSICEGSPVAVNFSTSSTDNIKVDYIISNNGVLTNRSLTYKNSDSPVDNVVVNGPFSVTVTYAQYDAAPVCANTTRATYTLPVNARPTATLSNPVTICEGNSTNITVTLTGKLPYTFNLNDGTTITAYTANVNPYNIPVTPNVGVTNFSVENISDANSCMTATAVNTTKVTVVAKPTVNLDFDPGLTSQSICKGQTIKLRFDVAGGVAPYTVVYTDGNGNDFNYIANNTGFNILTITPSATATYSVKSIRESGNNCNGTVLTGTPKVTVNQVPNITLAPEVLETCEGTKVKVRATITASNKVNFTVQNSDASDVFESVLTSPAGVSPGIYDFFLNPTVGTNNYVVSVISDVVSGCSRTGVNPFTIRVNQKPVASISTTTSQCQGEGPVTLNINISKGSGNIVVNYANDRGFTDSYTASGTGLFQTMPDPLDETGSIKYFITSIVATSASGIQCSNNGPFTDTAVAIINPTPLATIVSTTPIICQGSSATLVFKAQGNGPIEVDYLVDGITSTIKLTTDSDADGFLDNTLVVTPNTSKTYRITQVRDNSSPTCVNLNPNFSYTVKVNQNPEASLVGEGVRPDEVSICEGQSTRLIFNLRGKAPISLSYSINGTTFTKTGLLPGLNVINYTPAAPVTDIYSVDINSVSDGNSPTCLVTKPSPNISGTLSIRVTGLPIAEITTANDQICEGSSTALRVRVTNFEAVSPSPLAPKNPFVLSYSANGVVLSDTIIVNSTIGSPDFGTFDLTVVPSVTTIYRLLSIKEGSANKCDNSLIGSANTEVTITVNKAPVISLVAPQNVCGDASGNASVPVVVNVKAGNLPLTLNRYTIINGLSINPVTTDVKTLSAATSTQTFVLPVTALTSDSTYLIIAPGDLQASMPPTLACINKDTVRIGVIVNPLPTGSFTVQTESLDGNGVCEGDSIDLRFVIAGRERVRVNFEIKESPLGGGTPVIKTDFVEGLPVNGALDYRLVIVNPTLVTITSIISTNAATTCTGVVPVGKKQFIQLNLNPKPTVLISTPTNPVCEGSPVTIGLTFGGGTAPFDAEVQYKNLLTGVVTSNFLTGLNGATTLAPQAFTDTTLISVIYIRDNASPTQCVNTDTTSLQLNVNKVETARIYGDSTFCIGGQAGFMVDLTGQGNITFVYKDNAGITYPSITKVAGTYFIPVTQSPSTRVYTLVSVNDLSVPNCTGRVSGSARLVVKPQPQAIMSDENTICAGESTTITLQLIGGLATDTLVAYFKDDLGNTFTYVNRPGTYGVELSPIATSNYTLDSIAYKRFGCVSTNVSGNGKINVRQLPTVVLTAPTDICRGQELTVNLALADVGPFNVTYQFDNSTPVSESNVGTSLDVKITPTATTTFKVLNITYRDLPMCVSANIAGLATSTTIVNDTLKVVVGAPVPNSTRTGFKVPFVLSGGKLGTYTLNGVPVMGTDSSANVPNGENVFVFADASGCNDTTVVIDFTAPCLSFAGTMANTTTVVQACEDEVISVIHNGDQVLDANDALVYVLHTNPGTSLGTVLARSATPSFDIKAVGFPPLVYGQVYYISPVVADSIAGGGFVLNDRCLSVGAGTPVSFNQNSSVSLSLVKNAKDSICANQPLQFRLAFKGVGPFTVQYQILNNLDVAIEGGTIPVTASPVTVVTSTAIINTNGKIVLSNFDDLGINTACERYIPNDTLPFTVSPIPDVNFNASDLTVCEGTSVTFTPVIIDPTNTYNWNFVAGVSNQTTPTFTFDNAGTYNVTLSVTNKFGCVATSPAKQVIVDAPKQVNFSSIPNQSLYCANTDVTFTTLGVPALNAGDQVQWYVDGALKLDNAGDNPTFLTSFTTRGEHVVKLVATTLTGCVDSVSRVVRVEDPVAVINPVKFVTPCVGSPFTFGFKDSVDVKSWTWTFSNNVAPTRASENPLTLSFANNVVDYGLNTPVVTLKLTSAGGCTSEYNIPFELNKIGVSFTIDGLMQNEVECIGESNDFVATALPNNGLISNWNWNFGDNTTSALQTPTPKTYDAAGNYNVKLTATSTIGCIADTTLQILVNPQPVFTVNTDTICGNQLPELLAIGTDTYIWQGQGIVAGTEVTPKPTFVVPQNVVNGDKFDYLVIGTSAATGCRDTIMTSYTYFNLADPNNPLLYPLFVDAIDTTFNIGYPLNFFTVKSNGDTTYHQDFNLRDSRFRYNWFPTAGVSCATCPNPSLQPEVSSGYTLTVSDILGCYRRTATVTIDYLFKTSIDVPDAFTPNNDGINDVIFPDGLAVDKILEFSVYNRYGELIHSGSGKREDAAWNGYYNGKIQPGDTYSYKAVVKTTASTGGVELRKSGSFSLIP